MTGFWKHAAAWLTAPVPGMAAAGGRIGAALSAAQRAQVRATIGEIEDFLRAQAPVVDAGMDAEPPRPAQPFRSRRREARSAARRSGWRTRRRG